MLTILKEPIANTPEVFEFFNHSKIPDFQRQYLIAESSEVLVLEERLKELFQANGKTTTLEQYDKKTRIIRSSGIIKTIIYSFHPDRHLIYFYNLDEEF